MSGRLQIRAILGGLLLAVFGYCMAQLLDERGLLKETALVELIPDLVSSPYSAPIQEVKPELAVSPEPRKKHIIVDAGHGGRDGGTQGHGMLEKEWTMLIALLLNDDLKERGFDVRMTRKGDDTLDLAERTQVSNGEANHLFVSVHLNWSAQPKVSGIETFFSPGRVLTAEKEVRRELEVPPGAVLDDTRSQLLAEAVQQHVTAVTSANDRGGKDGAHLFVLRHCVAPAILIECGFLSNEWEAGLILKPSYLKRLASGIADGITHFLNSVKEDELYGVMITPERPEIPSPEVLSLSATTIPTEAGDLPDVPTFGVAQEDVVAAP
jgi:N-acetylmuramoyl-L-alanine amidase